MSYNNLEYRKVTYTAEINPGGLWKAKAIECNVKGTHENYNVIYNSDCVGECFATSDEAIAAAKNAVEKYCQNFHKKNR